MKKALTMGLVAGSDTPLDGQDNLVFRAATAILTAGLTFKTMHVDL
jgi:hypothetical protein